MITRTSYDPKADKWSTEPCEPPEKPYLVLRSFQSYCEPTIGYQEIYVTKDQLFQAELIELKEFPTRTDFRYVPEINPDLVIVTLTMQKIEEIPESTFLD